MKDHQIIVNVKVIPKSKQNEIVGFEGDVLKIRLKAVAEKGKANNALISFLAEKLAISKDAISILSGQTSRLKRLSITGITTDQVKSLAI